MRVGTLLKCQGNGHAAGSGSAQFSSENVRKLKLNCKGTVGMDGHMGRSWCHALNLEHQRQTQKRIVRKLQMHRIYSHSGLTVHAEIQNGLWLIHATDWVLQGPPGRIVFAATSRLIELTTLSPDEAHEEILRSYARVCGLAIDRVLKRFAPSLA